jgi:site-specific DNA-cytosine methylase
MRDSAGPSAPSAPSLIANDLDVMPQREKRPRKNTVEHARAAPAPASVTFPSDDLYFAEFFAGEAGLTKTMRDRGVTCRGADELIDGGTDFHKADQVDQLKEELRERRMNGATLALHFAPPCATFSRARDRASATQLRSTAHPEGLPGLDADRRSLAEEANAVALQAFDLAAWAARDLSAIVTFENPAASYMWGLVAKLRPAVKATWEDLTLSQCFFGTKYRKDPPSP